MITSAYLSFPEKTEINIKRIATNNTIIVASGDD